MYEVRSNFISRRESDWLRNWKVVGDTVLALVENKEKEEEEEEEKQILRAGAFIHDKWQSGHEAELP